MYIIFNFCQVQSAKFHYTLHLQLPAVENGYEVTKIQKNSLKPKVDRSGLIL